MSSNRRLIQLLDEMNLWEGKPLLTINDYSALYNHLLLKRDESPKVKEALEIVDEYLIR